MRAGSTGWANCAATRRITAGSKGFSTLRSTPPWSCRASSWRLKTAGLGCCPISVIRNHADAVAEILELPDKVFPVAGLCLGYPAGEGHISMRLPLAVTVHTDRYDDAALAEEIANYDRRRAARYATPREQQRAPDVFGYADFYGWSEDKARQAAAQPEGRGFAPHLRARGFSFD